MSPRGGGCVPLTDAQRAETEKHLKLCGYAANRFARKYRHVARGEFLSAAFEGLADAVKAFDGSRGVALECYAPHRIEGACRDAIRRARGGVVRVPRAAGGDAPRVVSIDALDPVSGRAWAESIPARESPPALTPEESARLAIHLARLGRRERFIIVHLYGLDGGDAWTKDAIGEYLGLDPVRVRRVEGVAIAKLREAWTGNATRRSVGNAFGRPRLTSRPVSLAEARAELAGAIAGRRDRVGAGDVPLDGLLDRLTPPRRLVVEMHHGLDGVARPLPEIARTLGRTREGVHQIYKAAMRSLRETYRRDASGGGVCPIR